MQNLTVNEARVMDFLVRNFKERNSINQIAKRLKLSPMGAYKILKKLEKANAIKAEKIGNAVYYRANLDEEIGRKLAEFVLVQSEFNNTFAKVYADDLRKLKYVALSCILYGSILKAGKEAKDVDALIIIEKKDYKKVSNKLADIQQIATKRIHDIRMTKEDLAKNLKKGNEAMIDMLKYGQVLWGAGIIVEAIKNGAS
ncbi:winged helix-turn-helix transcriptional regulator [Candidatus Woesearchaeota archaeon]|nr:winged helix-turn-helix transcriptional regulator [Candidatus Woesearchaeota archaeon]